VICVLSWLGRDCVLRAGDERGVYGRKAPRAEAAARHSEHFARGSFIDEGGCGKWKCCVF